MQIGDHSKLVENSENPQFGQISDQQRLANFVSLRNLENQLSPEMFEQVVKQFDDNQTLPRRQAWDGSLQLCSYRENQLNSGHSRESSLPFLLENRQNLAGQIQNFLNIKNSTKNRKNPVRNSLKKCHLSNFAENSSRLAYISNFKNRGKLSKLFQNQNLKSKHKKLERVVSRNRTENFQRMKTVFGHAIFADGSGTPVYNCKFDRLNRLIITGGDDGIIKIWNKDNLILQASLHGHEDMIIDIQVSHCNRYMASGSKDGTIIIWDIEKCSIIKKITDNVIGHESQVNRIRFQMIECTAKQTKKNLQNMQVSKGEITRNLAFIPMISNVQSGVQQETKPEIHYDQFLISCSDDGSINIYDCSSFRQNCNDEYYTKGVTDSNQIYTPHSKAISAKLQEDSFFGAGPKTVEDVNFNKAEEIEQQQMNDKISRKTRKRNFGNQKPEGIANQNTANSSSASPNCSQETSLNMLKLKPEDFRMGAKNRHIDAFSVNKKGFLIGGTNQGEVLLWKVNFGNIRQKKSDQHYQWVNSFKLHKKANHYVEFSPEGNILMTGSADGTCSLWDTSFLQKTVRKFNPNDDQDQIIDEPKTSNIDLKNIEIGDETLIHTFKVDTDKLESAIDSIEWSKNGRYAFCAMSVKPKSDEGETEANKQPVVEIKVYDTASKQIIENLDKVCNLGKDIKNYTCVMKAHPIHENILLACFDGGITILYDVRSHEIIQEIVEYGIYSIDQYIMNNQVDVDFSSCGEYIAMTSIYGTLTLYSTLHHKIVQYECTRVQQFFMYDDQMHGENIYETLTTRPLVGGFELNPYEVQPNAPIIGKFKDSDINMDNEEFEKQQIFAREFAVEEEKFYQDQLQTGLRRGLFNQSANDAQEADAAPAGDSNVQALISFNAVDAEMHEESDEDLLRPQTRARRNASRGRNENGTGTRRRMRRTDELTEQLDMTEDENFDRSASESSNLSKSDSYGSLDSERQGGKFIRGNHLNQDHSQNNFQRQNYHIGSQQQTVGVRQQRNKVIDDDDDSEDIVQRRGPRTRQNNGTQGSQSQSNQITRRVQRRALQHVNESDSQDESNFGDRPRRRGRNRRGQQSDLSMEHISINSDDRPNRRSGRNSRNRNEPIISRTRNQSRGRNDRSQAPGQSRGQRAMIRRNYVEEDSMMDATPKPSEIYQSETNEVDQSESIDPQQDLEKQKLDEHLENLITKPNFKTEYEIDDRFSQRGSKSKKGAVIIKEGRISNHSAPPDEVYELKDRGNISMENKSCSLCKRTMDKEQLIGPFMKEQPQAINQIMESQEDDLEQVTGLFFHLKCLAVNQYVSYDKKNDKWVNIKTAIENLVENMSYTCYRCLLPGASIQCMNCDRKFHGHYCNKLYMLSTDYEDQNFLCIFCKNDSNYVDSKGLNKKNITQFATEKAAKLRKKINKTQIIEPKAFQRDNFYVPQINDEVIYFYQGHEKFYQQNNCFFYCGNNKQMGSKDLPWMNNSHVKNLPHGQLTCKVLNVTHKFPSLQAGYLIDLFGDCSSDITQVQEIITYVELEVIEPEFPKNKLNVFVVEIFPSEAPQFLVPKIIFDKKLELFEETIKEDKLFGKRFKTTRGKTLFSGHEVLVKGFQPLEPDYLVESYWESIQVVEVEPQQMRGRRTTSSAEERNLNFWELIYPSEVEQKLTFNSYMQCAFEEYENERLIDKIRLFIQQKTELCQDYLERVQEHIANDYRSWIPAEMWLNLVLDRLTNLYYRSQDQLWYDLDLISFCSTIYNGDEDDLTLNAQQMVEKLRKELKQLINYNNEKMLQKKPKLVNTDNSTPIFGFSGPVIEEQKEQTEIKKIKDKIPNQLKFGDGGETIKNHLQDTQDFDYQPHEFDELDAEDEEEGNQIKIDLNQKSSQDEEAMPKRRGRPRKRALDSGEKNGFLISMNMESNVQGSSSNQNVGSQRKSNEGKNSATSGVLRKTRRQMKIAENQLAESEVVPNEVQIGSKRNHQKMSKEDVDGLHDDFEEPEMDSNQENVMHNSKIQIHVGNTRRSSRVKRQKIDFK